MLFCAVPLWPTTRERLRKALQGSKKGVKEGDSVWKRRYRDIRDRRREKDGGKETGKMGGGRERV